MDFNIMFFVNSILLGVGLAMDAFSVSLADGLNEPKMKKRKVVFIAGIFAIFQALMPLIGWVLVHTVVEYFKSFEKFIPFIALALLSYIGGKMLFDGIRHKNDKTEKQVLTLGVLLIQGVATSIDALSVGFTIAEYNLLMAVIAAVIIAVVTFVICLLGLLAGKKFGTSLSNKAEIFGGLILIAIGLEIFISALIK